MKMGSRVNMLNNIAGVKSIKEINTVSWGCVNMNIKVTTNDEGGIHRWEELNQCVKLIIKRIWTWTWRTINTSNQCRMSIRSNTDYQTFKVGESGMIHNSMRQAAIYEKANSATRAMCTRSLTQFIRWWCDGLNQTIGISRANMSFD